MKTIHLHIEIYLLIIVASLQAIFPCYAELYYGDVGEPKANEVHIGKTGIVMPIGYFLLARKGTEYCAIKFIDSWSENKSEVGSLFVASGADEFATYESYYQGDVTANLSNKSVQCKEGKLSFPKPRGIGRFAFSFGNKEIKCGEIRLFWSGKGSVHFYGENQNQGNYGIELAPTNWKSIEEVKYTDPRLIWYKYDENRERKNIPLERIW